ncbi:MAG: hypothetical protein EAZ35_02260 [Sphingobacteriia bacterium]|nr:MAG: hypothetical protein EAZ35_02260 [Sphingobacteriia bacterium]
MQETREFILIVERLTRAYGLLPNLAATEAVKFSKNRFRAENWIGNTTENWKKRVRKDKRTGRAILVNKAILKRDIHKIYVGPDRAIIGTTKLSAPYAKAHNEGFSGKVNVKEHKRRRFKKVEETYTSKTGKEKKRTSKQVDESGGNIIVKSYSKKMKLPKRQFMGVSPVLDNIIQRSITAALIKAIKK